MNNYYITASITVYQTCPKCVNSAMRPSFKEKFTEIRICGSREQCMGPTKKRQHKHKRKHVCTQTVT